MALPLEQAIGQKLMISFAGYTLPQDLEALLQQRHVGGVCLFRELNNLAPAQVRELTGALQNAAARSGQPPLLIATDQECGQLMAIGGGTTPFPGNLALGACASADLAHRVGRALGSELAAVGVNVNFAPVCDVSINPRNPVVGTRSFGQDPALVAELCSALITGLQSAGVAATAKHFPGHGDADGDSHHALAVVRHDRQRLNQVELPPFQAAIEAQVRLIMTAHVAFHALDGEIELPATLSRGLLRGILRSELGFKGLVVSDALNMAPIGRGERLIIDALAATLAGVDLLLLHDDSTMQQAVFDGLLHAARRGLLSREEVLTSAERIVALKRWVSGIDQPALDVVGCLEHQNLALEVAARSVTLVRDYANLLPLSLQSQQRVAVIVPQPIDLTPADTSSYERCALAEAFRHYHLAVDELVVPHHPTADDISAVLQRIADYDLAVVGTINAVESPGQAALVEALLQTHVPIIAVALRMPTDLEAYPSAPTYICTYGLQPPSLEALVQGLLGHIPFAGRLPLAVGELYPLGYRLEASGAYQIL